MGVDFLRATAPSFKRVLDRRLVELHTPRLFDQDVPVVSRSACADICNGAKIRPGEKVLIRLIDGKVVAQRDNLVVAECPNPPSYFLIHLQEGAGVAEGEIKSLQPISQTVEINICE